MGRDLRDRSRWLARNVLPFEGLLRAKLRAIRVYDLDIDDVIQETYSRMLSIEALDSIRYPKQYALLTARAIVIDHIRHTRVVSIISSETLEVLDVPEPEPSVEKRLEFQEELVAVNRALSRLPKLWREILILRRVEHLPQKDVARRLGISERTVEKYLAKGARLLARIIAQGGKWRPSSSYLAQEARIKDAKNKSGD